MRDKPILLLHPTQWRAFEVAGYDMSLFALIEPMLSADEPHLLMDDMNENFLRVSG